MDKVMAKYIRYQAYFVLAHPVITVLNILLKSHTPALLNCIMLVSFGGWIGRMAAVISGAGAHNTSHTQVGLSRRRAGDITGYLKARSAQH